MGKLGWIETILQQSKMYKTININLTKIAYRICEEGEILFDLFGSKTSILGHAIGRGDA